VPSTYIVMTGNDPISAATDLATAQAAAMQAQTQYETEAREYRWDQFTAWGPRTGWQLMVRSPRTNRWSKTLRSVVEVPVLPSA
jgi:hypothetical protein